MGRRARLQSGEGGLGKKNELFADGLGGAGGRGQDGWDCL